MLAIDGMRGDLAELTRPMICVPGAVATPTVAFRIAMRRGRRPRTVHA
jgi:hypothetical protein